MNLQGNFEGLFLTSILQLLCNDQKTGMLRITSGENECKVFFENGTIVYASGSQKEARLGYILRRDGIISPEQVQKCLALARKKQLSLGRILVDKGYVSMATLKKYNTKQVEEILYNVLLWKKGSFEYKDVKLKLEGMVITQLNPMKLILEASRRIDEMSILTEVIPNNKMVFQISGNVKNKEEIKLNANEWGILSLIDGSRTIKQIITQSGYDEFPVYKIFFSLISYGLIDEKEQVQLSDLQESAGYSAIINVYHDILQTVHKNIRQELGDRASSIFEETGSELGPQFKKILQDYHPSLPVSQNIKTISDALDTLEDSERVHDLLVTGFNAYSTLILKKVAYILGIHPIQNILKEIEKVIGYVKKYHPDSTEKHSIINDVNDIINNIKAHLGKEEDKKGKSKGFFSFFSLTFF